MDKELADHFREHDRLAMEKNGPSVNEEEVTFASDGHRELLETTNTPLRDERGRLIGVLGISHDITERKRIEVALRELEERYSKAFHTSPDAININRIADGSYIEANESFLMTMGYARSEVIGKTSLELEIWVDPTARSQMLKCLMEDGNVRNF
ncbi:MAG: PAS domain S-box protein, partial [Burkholderiaceae bacterium]|nr:PAS domain S-box protein [Burkholderiaceae bacterium]